MATLRHIRRERRPLGMLGASLAFGLVLLTPLACSGSAGEAPGAAVAPQGDLIASLPVGATTIGSIEVAQLRDAGLYDFAREQGADLGESEIFEEFIARTGIDPRTDLHRIVWATTGGMMDGGESAGAALVVATFDRTRLLESLADVETIEYGGYQLYLLDDLEAEMQDDDSNDEDSVEDDSSDDDADGPAMSFNFDTSGALAILSDDTLAVGSQAAVRQIIDVRAGAPSARANVELMALLEDVATDSQLWAIAAQDGLLGGLRASGDTPMPQIPVDRINALILSLRFTDGLALTLRGRTGAKEDAKLLGDSLNGMLAFGKMMLQSSQPEVFAILDQGVTAGSSGSDVTIRANLTMEQIERLRSFANEAMSSEGAAQSEIG